MINLNADESDDGKRAAGGGAGAGPVMWKALIYDEYCQEIVAPLMHVHELRALGVTVNLSVALCTRSAPKRRTDFVFAACASCSPLMSKRERVPVCRALRNRAAPSKCER